jgi:FdrA protein
MLHLDIRRSTYLDSISLMRISKMANDATGIRSAVVAMGTDTNLSLLKEVGFDTASLRDVTPNDLVIAIDAADESALDEVLKLVRRELKGGVAGAAEGTADGAYAPVSLEATIDQHPEINLVLISVPGRFAAVEAEKAVQAGKHVMIFSDNVSLEDEIRLKTYAAQEGLLVMGPDCGTAIINGVGLGFANAVPRGNIGLVAASGTGAQEVSSILARRGLGISQLIGTGGRDVSAEVGGTMMIMGLESLLADDRTSTVVLVSKLPNEQVAESILTTAEQGGKPCVVYFAGSSRTNSRGNIVFTPTLAETARQAAMAAGGGWELDRSSTETLKQTIGEMRQRLPRSRRFLRGLFSGGTLAQEAIFIIGSSLEAIHTNLKVPGFPILRDPTASMAHTIVDLGDDAFTRGRAHPMIDQSCRLTRLAREIQDPETAVILLDIVLGYGCNGDPAGEIVQSIRRGGPIVIASICGTQQDPQNYYRQRDTLESAGVIVAETNAEACELALEAVKDN